MRIATFLVVFAFSFPAIAQEWPDLLGTWKGTSRSVVSGVGGHFGGEHDDKPRFAEVELTIEWTEQNEGRYIGTLTSGSHTEGKLGVVSADGTSLVTVDHDGQSVGRIIDGNSFELCYAQTSHSDEQMVVSCVIFNRQ